MLVVELAYASAFTPGTGKGLDASVVCVDLELGVWLPAKEGAS